MGDILLKINNVSKRFGPTLALKDINLTVKSGTIHSLVGRNGAGKSTLVNVIAGIHTQDGGSVYLEDKEISHNTIFERQKLGVRMVTQHASVIPHLSVAENIFLGLWPNNKYNLVDWEAMYSLAVNELIEYGLDVDPKELVKNLSPIEQRKVNIIRALYGGGRLIILDEPTTSLSSEDRDNLFSFVRKLTEKGTTFILISHYLEEVIKLSDEMSVLRDGMAFTGYTRDTVNEEKLASLIAGEEVTLTKRDNNEEFSNKDVALECNNLCADNLKGVSIKVHKGEIVGIVGFPSSGAREFCRTLYGLSEILDGEIRVKNQIAKITDPSSALDNGIVYIPNDRHKEGIVQILSIRENMALPILKRKLKGKFGFLNSILEKDIAQKGMEGLRVKANSIEDKLGSLSGGNQQKVIISKALASAPAILILDEPTVGIDIKSREEILEIVNKMTKTGMTVLYLTNDYDELIRMSDRLVFFSNGRIKAVKRNLGFTAEDIIYIRDSEKDGAYEN